MFPSLAYLAGCRALDLDCPASGHGPTNSEAHCIGGLETWPSPSSLPPLRSQAWHLLSTELCVVTVLLVTGMTADWPSPPQATPSFQTQDCGLGIHPGPFAKAPGGMPKLEFAAELC